jgi:hypothetical protein
MSPGYLLTRIRSGSDSASDSASGSSSGAGSGSGSDTLFVSIYISRPNPGPKDSFSHETLSTVVVHRTKDQVQMSSDESCQLHTGPGSLVNG